MFAGLSLLLVPVLGQNLSEISVNEEANLALLDFLQNNSLGIMLEKNTTATTITTTIISNYLEFIDSQNTSFFLNQSRQNVGGVHPLRRMIGLGQQECYTGMEKWGRTNFHAIGTITSRMQNGSEQICLGTLLGSESVITLLECFKEDTAEYFYQPIWSPSWRIRIVDHYIPSQNEPIQNFVVLYLEDKLLEAPKMDIQLALLQDQKCHIAVLGWEKSFADKDNFKIVMCPNLPQLRQLTGVDPENLTSCKAGYCNLESFQFLSGAAIVLTCPPQNTLIGMLKFEVEIFDGQQFTDRYAVPFMFSQQTVWDIKKAVTRKKCL